MQSQPLSDSRGGNWMSSRAVCRQWWERWLLCHCVSQFLALSPERPINSGGEGGWGRFLLTWSPYMQVRLSRLCCKPLALGSGVALAALGHTHLHAICLYSIVPFCDEGFSLVVSADVRQTLCFIPLRFIPHWPELGQYIYSLEVGQPPNCIFTFNIKPIFQS